MIHRDGRRQRRGNYLMTMPFFLPVMIGFAAISVDVSYINMSKTQAQNVADAASHAAFVSYRTTNSFTVGDASAAYIVQANRVGNGTATLDSVQYGEWDFDEANPALRFDPTSQYVNAAKATVSRQGGNALDLFFAPILGYNTANVDADGVTAGRTREIMIVQDVSCSFDDDIFNARNANLAFLDYMADHPYPGDKIGMTLFGGMAQYPVLQELRLVEGNYTAIRNRFEDLDYCSALPNYLDGNPSSHCNTAQARGLHQARDEFIARGDSREFQAVILISDGLPTAYLSGGGNVGSQYNGRTQKREAELVINQLDQGGSHTYRIWLCNSSGGNCQNYVRTATFQGGVHVWTVTFENGGGNFSWMDSLPRGMGRSYRTPDPSELENIMLEIASSIPVVLTE